MSAFTVTLRTDASEVPAVIAGRVNLLKFSEALARAGVVGRHDADRGALVIEPAHEPHKAEIPAWSGMAIYNAWTREERSLWHRVAASGVPADAVAAFQSAAAGRAARRTEAKRHGCRTKPRPCAGVFVSVPHGCGLVGLLIRV
ncbi:MAG: hypothetical protein ACP5P4_02495 [Steroidobacteraceae bacterium]